MFWHEYQQATETEYGWTAPSRINFAWGFSSWFIKNSINVHHCFVSGTVVHLVSSYLTYKNHCVSGFTLKRMFDSSSCFTVHIATVNVCVVSCRSKLVMSFLKFAPAMFHIKYSQAFPTFNQFHIGRDRKLGGDPGCCNVTIIVITKVIFQMTNTADTLIC